jgi:hypothetical protein
MNKIPSSVDEIRTTAVLDGWDKYRRQAATSNRANRVKIPKGHSWLVRFLPFEMGENKLPFAWLAQHWVGGKPIFCKQYTDPQFGGDPNYVCPVCDVADAMYNEAENQADQDQFYQCKMREHVFMYCLVLAKEDDRGSCDQMSNEEILSPYEFNIPKSSFALLSAKVERSKQRKGASGIGLLDLETGLDLWASRDKKNSLSFEYSEDGPGPIFELDDNFEPKLLKVWRQLKQPVVRFLSDDRLNAVADKIAEYAFDKAGEAARDNDGGGSSGRGRGGSGRGRGGDETEDRPASRGRGRTQTEEQPQESRFGRRSARSEEPARPPTRSGRFASAQRALEEGDPQDDDQIPGAEAPSRTRPRAVTADDGGEEETAPSVRRSAGSTQRPSAAVSAARRGAAAPARQERPTGAGRPATRNTRAAQVSNDEDDPNNMPEESADPAPPAEDMGETPEPTPRTASRTTAPTVKRTDLASALGSRIRKMQNQPEA